MTTGGTPVRAEAHKQAAFFDLDKTIIAKASMAAFREPFYAHGLINRRAITRALIARFVSLHLRATEKQLVGLRTTILHITKGWKKTEVVAIVEEALEEIVEPIIFAEAMDLVESHREAGRLVVIVSASPEEIVGPLARHLGIDETIASRAGIDANGCYTGEMEFYAYGAFKADAIRDLAERLGVSLADSYAYSDSFSDIAMLEATGHPVAVNPDRDLARIARDRGWEVLRFVRPVKLRDRVRERVHAPERPRITWSIAVALAIGVSLAGWWYVARRENRGARKARYRVL